MKPLKLHRRGALQASLAWGLLHALPSARACEFATPTLRITHPWARSTPPESRSFAIVCMKFDEVRRTDRLIDVESPVASGAEMGGAGGSGPVNVVIPQGEETLLGETGTQLRLVGLKHPLEVARSYPMRLVFEEGGAVEVTLNIDYQSFRFR